LQQQTSGRTAVPPKGGQDRPNGLNLSAAEVHGGLVRRRPPERGRCATLPAWRWYIPGRSRRADLGFVRVEPGGDRVTVAGRPPARSARSPHSKIRSVGWAQRRPHRLDGNTDGLMEADYPAHLIEPMGRVSIAYRNGWSAAVTAADRPYKRPRVRDGRPRPPRRVRGARERHQRERVQSRGACTATTSSTSPGSRAAPDRRRAAPLYAPHRLAGR
jgi:hypothetical protein